MTTAASAQSEPKPPLELKPAVAERLFEFGDSGGLRVFLLPPKMPRADRVQFEANLKGTDERPLISFAKEGVKLQWRPGMAAVEAAPGLVEKILPSLADFAEWEESLRHLEAELERIEPEAPGDVKYAYRPQRRHRAHWPRIVARMEELYRMRLRYVRLAPKLEKPAWGFPPEGRRAVARLMRLTDVEERLESLGDRLEAVEDLYEGATDRVNDYRMYRDGHKLEILIIVLLALELFVMAGEIYVSRMIYQATLAASVDP